jgi:hypothetical protein
MLWPGRPRNRGSLSGKGNGLLCTVSQDRIWSPTQPHPMANFFWGGGLSPEIKRSGREFDNLSLHRTNGFSDFVHRLDFKELEDTKHDVSESGSVSVLRWGETPTLLGPLENANLNHCTRKTRRFGNRICFRPQVRGDTYSVGSLRES